MTRGSKQPRQPPKAKQQLEQTAREFAARVLASTKRRDPAAEDRRERREEEVSRALAAHLASRKK